MRRVLTVFGEIRKAHARALVGYLIGLRNNIATLLLLCHERKEIW